MDYINQLICGDCTKVLKNIPSDSIGGCITDPPYNYEFVGHNWDNTEIERRLDKVKASSSTLVKNIPYGSGLAGGVRNERWYKKNRENILEYQSWIRIWGKELHRVLKPGALVFIFNSTRTIAHVQIALEDVGFYTRDIIAWRRNSGIPKGINMALKLKKMGDCNADQWEGWHSCLRNEWEAIVVVQKPLLNNYIETIKNSHVGLFHAKTSDGFQSNLIENIKRDITDNFNTHPTVKPIELIEKLIALSIPKGFSNIVIDPFIGSGTTAVAAKKLDIDFIGIDISEEYIEIAKKRLQQI